VSQITLREKFIKSEVVITKERRSLRKDVAKLYHGVNDYFGIEEGTTDVLWWWGFIGFSVVTTIFIIVMNVLVAGV
jgi:hypothetical protein